ncbi:hypothetical protein N0V82_008989 [Gnomoniopsis sp. IMI 355080]|nr:hypothetical protein N0V82_008989 [Gnomoniopsis sp. IMI 355080]
MQCQDVDQVGEEPIYCETQHDDILYSGSEDEYYEAPEHRRLRIEAKAVQFLNGNLPYLLCARLKGPFSSKSWNNPWKSKRAQRQGAQRKVHSQSRRSMTTVEAARGPSSGRAIDDLPDTQRTSLYPLPSPETTNPPSARKNQYMAEEEFNRIRTWRETVKSVPVITDPFWASQQDETQQSTTTRKRSADRDWLRKQGSKKRKSEASRKLAPVESPSQTAAKMRNNLLQDRLAEIVPQSAPDSFTHEDELAAHWGPKFASFDASRMGNIPIKTPSVLQTARTPQPPTRQLLIQDPDSSEDELSMPSIAPSRNASRSPLKQPLTSNADNTPSRQDKRNSGDASWSRRCVAAETVDLDPNFTVSQRSVMANSGHILSQRKKTADNVSTTQIAHQDMCDATLDASQTHIPISQRMPQETSSNLAKGTMRRALGASQQDNSFYFHQAASKSPERNQNVQPRHQTKTTTCKFTLSQQGAPTLATELPNRKVDQLCVKDDGVCAPAPLDCQMEVVSSDNQEITPTALEMALMSNEHMKEAGEISSGIQAMQAQINEALPAVERRPESEAVALGQLKCERSQTCGTDEPDLSTHACTQELSPVSMQHKAQSTVVTTNAPEGHFPVTRGAVDKNDPSSPDWSTYINTQTLSTASEKPSPSVKVAKDVQAVSQDADDTDDPDWTTFIDTQDIEGPSTKHGMTSKDEGGLLTVEQGPDHTPDVEWSSFVNIQNRHTAETQCDEAAVVDDRRGLDLAFSDHRVTESIADDMDSSSELSSCMSVSSPGDASHTGDASNEPVVTEASAAESRSSEVTLGSIIDAYAEIKENEFENCSDGRSSAGHRQTPDSVTECSDTSVAPESKESQQENPTISIKGDLLIPTASIQQIEQSIGRLENSALNFDETAVNFDSPIPTVEEAPVQSPWAKGGTDLPMPVITSIDTISNETTSKLSFLAGQALAFSPASQTPWAGDRLPSPDFSLSLKKFSDFMIPSPSKKRASSDGSILRGLGSASRRLVGTPIPSKPKRRVTFAPLPGEEQPVPALESRDNEIYVEEDLSYFDSKGNKTASIRITRSQTRAASPPPSECDTANADVLPDHDDKFAKHFEAMSKRKMGPPRRSQRLLPSESQQTDGSQPIDAMAEAFIQASQTRQKTSELAEAVDDNARLFQSSSEKTNSPMIMDATEQQENIDPVDDVSAVLDNIDDFLDNSWGFDTSFNTHVEKEAPPKQQAETVPSRFANVGDPMVAMHANVWAD